MMTMVAVYLTLSFLSFMLVLAFLRGAGRDFALDLATLEPAARAEFTAAHLPTAEREPTAKVIAPAVRQRRARTALPKGRRGAAEDRRQHGAAERV